MAERLLNCTWCGSDIERPRNNKSANVATACLSCNARKQHHGGGEQLAVI